MFAEWRTYITKVYLYFYLISIYNYKVNSETHLYFEANKEAIDPLELQRGEL